jgi:hypothetical protein
MPYTINRYNGTQITVVADGTVDQTLDLKLVGKNYAGYGAIQNENFVYLLENFANNNAPGKPLPGQLWYDTSNNKLKFYDENGNWRTTGGSTTASTAPTGLTPGDFWYDNVNNQLYTWNGSSYVLIGPQGVAGSGTTQMKSVSVRDTLGNSHAVIEALANNQVVYIISPDATFTLDGSVNPITGFTDIHQGITLAYTNNNSQLGQTTSNHRFWGTASNSDRLAGYDITNFTLSSNATFTTLVQFADIGYTVGNPARLHVFNTASWTGDSTLYPTVENIINDKIIFQTQSSGSTVTPLALIGNTLQPGTSNTNDIGTNLNQWRTVYANTFSGTATSAQTLILGGSGKYPSATIVADTVAVRTATDQTINGVNITAGSLLANYFSGTATAANYADLAEKYLPDTEYEIGTVVSVGGDKEITACQFGDHALGALSENPAFMMNQELVGGVYVALKGRVPVKVLGQVNKGDQLVAGPDGCAVTTNWGTDQTIPPFGIFAIALESSDDQTVKLIEAVIL